MPISSLLRRNIFIPLWVLRDKSPRLSYMREMEKSQYYDHDKLKHFQFSRLKEIIKHAYENTYYYGERFNELGIRPIDIKDEKDFQKIPLLTKKNIQDFSDTLIARNYEKKNLIAFKTGGSTGKAVTVYCDFKAMEKGVGSSLRCFEWTGWKIGEAIGRIWGNPKRNLRIKEKLRNALIEPQIFLDTMCLNEQAIIDFVGQWKKANPTLLHGHSHSLFIFAQFCKQMNIRDIRPKGIISTSMMLIPYERKLIEDYFECKITDLYGSEEVGLIGCECEEHRGMHLNIENVYIEFLNENGDRVSAGEQGAIVITNLNNKAMPIIRYKIEDMGAPSNRICKCGRRLPLMENISGRVADFLIKKDGSLVAGVSLVERTLTAIKGIQQMQIVQDDLENIILNIVKSDAYTEATGRKLRGAFEETFGNDIKINLNFVDNISQDRNGKYRFSISKIKNRYNQI